MVWAGEIRVQTATTGPNTSHIALQTDVQASSERVWSILTDYDHHADQLPYLTESRVLDRQPGRVVVHQAGQLRILLKTYRMEVRQAVTEDRPCRMAFRAVEGDFQQLEGEWILQATGSGTRLTCELTVQPKRRVPAWAVRLAARHYLKKMVRRLALLAEEGRP